LKRKPLKVENKSYKEIKEKDGRWSDVRKLFRLQLLGRHAALRDVKNDQHETCQFVNEIFMTG